MQDLLSLERSSLTLDDVAEHLNDCLKDGTVYLEAGKSLDTDLSRAYPTLFALNPLTGQPPAPHTGADPHL